MTTRAKEFSGYERTLIASALVRYFNDRCDHQMRLSDRTPQEYRAELEADIKGLQTLWEEFREAGR
jgi:hypothetical protein